MKTTNTKPFLAITSKFKQHSVSRESTGTEAENQQSRELQISTDLKEIRNQDRHSKDAENDNTHHEEIHNHRPRS
jgi:hypothetical protein